MPQGVVGISLEELIHRGQYFADRLTTLGTPSLYAPFNAGIVGTVWHAYDAVQLLGHACQRPIAALVDGPSLDERHSYGWRAVQGIVGDRVHARRRTGSQIAVTNCGNDLLTVAHWAVEGLVLAQPHRVAGQQCRTATVARRAALACCNRTESLPDAALSVMIILLLASGGVRYRDSRQSQSR